MNPIFTTLSHLVAPRENRYQTAHLQKHRSGVKLEIMHAKIISHTTAALNISAAFPQ